MKKLIKLLLLVVCILCSVLAVACDDDGDTTQKEGLQYYRVANQGEDAYYVIDGYVDSDGVTTLTIPSTLGDNNEPVKRIKAGAFSGNGKLTEIVVPDSVTEIDAGAFSGLTKLQKITLPFIGGKVNADGFIHETKTDINKAIDDQRLFGYIFGNENYNFGTQFTQRYASTDANDTDNKYVKTYFLPVTLTEVVISANDYTLPMYAFYGNTLVNKISFTGTVKEIGDYAFYGNTLLDNVSIPASVTRVGDYAFCGCQTLNSLTVNPTAVSFGDYCFKGSGLTQFTVKAGMTMGNYCFSESSLESVTVNCESISNGAFYKCSALTEVTSSANVIGIYSFANCTALIKFNSSEDFVIDFTGVDTVKAMAFANLGTNKYTVDNQPSSISLEEVFYNTELAD